ncbi:hypothetical protein [Kangiella sp.]|uniref:hypothetical protein n=1 Tax=Kangiella sp. TaxID=1920245 RepID=UPI003A90E12D
MQVSGLSDLSIDARGVCAIASKFAVIHDLDIDFLPRSHRIVALKVVDWMPNHVNKLIGQITEKLKEGDITFDQKENEIIVKTKSNIKLVA